jgi:polysaccharide export outer membrane protein
MAPVRADDIGPRLDQTPKTDAPYRAIHSLFLRLYRKAPKRQDIVNNASLRTDNYIAPRAPWCYSAALLGSSQLRNRMIGTAVSHWSFTEGQYWSDFGDAGQERRVHRTGFRAITAAIALFVAGCGGGPTLPPAPPASSLPSAEYRIGPGDSLNIFVWRNPELTVTVPVRPDGRLSIPLVEDVVAIGKTPSTLAREYEQRLAKYVKEPLVTVIVEGFVGPIPDQIRIIGEASQPRSLPYRADMTVLDAMIAVGGLTRYAAGNDTVLIRTAQGEQNTYSVHLNNLIRDGDIDSNVALRPGDILIIPQRLF